MHVHTISGGIEGQDLDDLQSPHGFGYHFHAPGLSRGQIQHAGFQSVRGLPHVQDPTAENHGIPADIGIILGNELDQAIPLHLVLFQPKALHPGAAAADDHFIKRSVDGQGLFQARSDEGYGLINRVDTRSGKGFHELFIGFAR